MVLGQQNYQEQKIDALVQIAYKDPINNIYDLSWFAFSKYKVNQGIVIKDLLVDLSKYKEVIISEKFLFDYRHAVGVMITLYLGKVTSAPWYDDGIALRVLDLLRKWNWHDFTGEIMFASLLLSKELGKDADVSKIAELCLNKIKSALESYKNFIMNARDYCYMILALSDLDEAHATQTLDLVKNSRLIFEKTIDRASSEVQIVLLWALAELKSKIPSSKELDEWINIIAQKFTDGDQNTSYFLPDKVFLEQVGETISLVKEGFGGTAKSLFGNFLKEYTSDSVTFDLTSINIGRPNLSLLAKMQIALNESGFLKPFRVSSKEYEAYEIAKEKLQGKAKFVRMYELAVGIVTLVVLVSVVTYYAILKYFPNYEALTSAIIFAYAVIGHAIWEKGKIDRESIKLILHIWWRKIKSMV